MVNSGAGHPEPQNDVPDVGAAAVPVGNRAVGRIAEPAASPYHPGRARGGAQRIIHRSCANTIVPVPAPLKHIPAHVAEPRGSVRRFRPHRMRAA
jgi:hypothetical protein